LLLAKDNNGYTAWHHAAIFGRLESLETLWSLSKEVEIKLDGLLLAESEEGETTLHFAAQKNHAEILQKLCVWAEKCQMNANELEQFCY